MSLSQLSLAIILILFLSKQLHMELIKTLVCLLMQPCKRLHLD